jgi:hypothetical protein
LREPKESCGGTQPNGQTQRIAEGVGILLSLGITPRVAESLAGMLVGTYVLGRVTDSTSIADLAEVEEAD